jgi:hypothetical protein
LVTAGTTFSVGTMLRSSLSTVYFESPVSGLTESTGMTVTAPDFSCSTRGPASWMVWKLAFVSL